MTTRSPRVSIGLPVYNGGALLARAIESYLEQDYEDLELIISDNASTDDSPEVCREAVRSDPRVRYFRCATNEGAVANFNRAYRLARGHYFKWAAHDDWCDRSLVSRCAKVLDTTPEAVLCHSAARLVLEDGSLEPLEPHHLDSPDPVKRFNHVLWRVGNTYPMFGLVRRRALAAGPLLSRDVGSDRVLLGSLSLLGQIHQIPDVLVYMGEARSARVAPRDSTYWAPENANRLTLLSFRLAKGFADVVIRSGLSPADKAVLLGDIGVRYGIRNAPRLAYETYLTAGEIIHHRPYKTVVSSSGSWLHRW